MYDIKPNCALCKSCDYFKHQNDTWGCCDYIGVTQHSRIFDDKGKRRLPVDKCDKYKPRRK